MWVFALKIFLGVLLCSSFVLAGRPINVTFDGRVTHLI